MNWRGIDKGTSRKSVLPRKPLGNLCYRPSSPTSSRGGTSEGVVEESDERELQLRLLRGL